MRRLAIQPAMFVALLMLVGPRFAFAQDGSPIASPPADGVMAETLYSVILPTGAVPDDPGGAAFLRFTVAPGTSFDFTTPCWVSPAVDVWYVEAGAFAIRPAAPATLVRAGDGGAAEPVAAGIEEVLGPGDLLVYTGLPPVPGEFRNAGDTPVSGLVFGVWGPQVANCPPTGMVEPWLNYLDGLDWLLPPGPLTLKLMRVTLAPGTSAPFPASAPDGDMLVLDHIEDALPTYDGEGNSRTLHNDGDAPLVALALTITPAGAAATPDAGTPSP